MTENQKDATTKLQDQENPKGALKFSTENRMSLLFEKAILVFVVLFCVL